MFAKIMSVLHAFMRELHEIVNFDAVLSSDLFLFNNQMSGLFCS